MKIKSIIKAEYTGDADNNGLIASFQFHVLSELKKRELLTEKQYEKAIKLLKEHR